MNWKIKVLKASTYNSLKKQLELKDDIIKQINESKTASIAGFQLEINNLRKRIDKQLLHITDMNVLIEADKELSKYLYTKIDELNTIIEDRPILILELEDRIKSLCQMNENQGITIGSLLEQVRNITLEREKNGRFISKKKVDETV